MGAQIQTERLAQQFDETRRRIPAPAQTRHAAKSWSAYQKNLIGQSTELNLEGTLLDDIILIAHDLSAADTIHFKDQRIEGFVTDMGGPTSHTAILGRSLNIPSVIGLGAARRLIREHEWVIVDGISGTLVIAPDELILAQYRQQQAAYRSQQRALNKLKKTAAQPKTTKK